MIHQRKCLVIGMAFMLSFGANFTWASNASESRAKANDHRDAEAAHGHDEDAKLKGQRESDRHAKKSDAHRDGESESAHSDMSRTGDSNAHSGEDAGTGDAHEKGADGHGKEESSQNVSLDDAQRKTLGLRTERLTRGGLNDTVTAPGEVKLNGYSTVEVTPRIAAQVMSRLVRLGELVTVGQPLVTLSSVEMAAAQGEFLVAEREWQRVRKLGEQVVSSRRYIEARVSREQTRARVIAYGMTESQIANLLRAGAAEAGGVFQLLSSQAGTIVEDTFHVGELIEPGRKLFRITDLGVLWVEASLRPRDAVHVEKGGRVRVRYQERWYEGTVVQVHRQLDEVTRTQGVRIELPDPEHQIAPGNFVDVVISVGAATDALALPEEALQRSSDGDWQVFIAESPNEFRAQEVKVIRRTAGLVVVDGLVEGTEVVTKGAFFLQSELAKGGFDIHGH